MISIDANTKRTGVALFSGGGLRAVAVLASKQKAPMLAGHEMAQQLKALGWLAPANDLLSGGEGVVEWPAHYGPYSKAPAKTVQEAQRVEGVGDEIHSHRGRWLVLRVVEPHGPGFDGR